LFNDLHVFFRIDISSDTKHLLTKSFEDGLIANKNARILKDVDGTIIMMYVFADDKSVIITNSEELLSQNWPQPDFNYLRFNSDLLSDDGIGQYLKLFDELGVNNKGLFLK